MTDSSRRNFLLSGLALPAVLNSATFLPQAQKSATPKLEYRTLGKTGLKVTTVGFGCMITSDQSVVEKGADLGINYFDTARGYQGGNNEKMVGAALKSKRKSLVISTKTHAGTKEQALQDLDTSLKELGTDYVDIWYLHGKSTPAELTDDLLEAQQIAKKAGKTRFVGVSTHGGHKELIPGMIAKAPHFDVVLATYNFTMNTDLDAVFETATKAGLGIVAMKVMAGGSKPGRGKPNPVLTREGAMLSALKWVLKNKNIHTTIPSITDMEQLDENMRAFSNQFSDVDQKILTARLQDIRPLYCSMCGSCDGKCPKGMPAADVLRYLTYAEGYGEFQLGRENFLALPEEIRNIRCSSCDTCTISCPNGVRVAQRLQIAQELFA
jgi:LSD1 subclass zinc finger protein